MACNKASIMAPVAPNDKMRGPFLESPGDFSGPVKLFLIHLYFKNGEVCTLKLLVWREPVFIFKNTWLKQLCNILYCFRVRPWRNGPQDPFNNGDQAPRSFLQCGCILSCLHTENHRRSYRFYIVTESRQSYIGKSLENDIYERAHNIRLR